MRREELDLFALSFVFLCTEEFSVRVAQGGAGRGSSARVIVPGNCEVTGQGEAPRRSRYCPT